MMGGEMPPMDGEQGGQMAYPNPMGADPNMMNNQAQGGSDGDSQFDTGFDAGVEADEDEDPKKFIQQLTGKLSQSLNKYNNENGEDPQLSKYVGKMIVKASAKGLDEKGRKDLIKSINTTDSPEDEEMPEDDNIGDDQMSDTEDIPMNECKFTKKELKKLNEELNQELMNNRSVNNDVPKQKSKANKSAFTPKQFK